MYSGNKFDKSRKAPLTSTRLLDQLRERLRYMHYSLRTEQNYVYWVRWFIRWHGVRHPKDMGGKEVEAFLSMLANERQVSPSTHRQALSALLFLYKEVLEIELPWMQDIGRPVPTKRIPIVLSVEEVTQILLLMSGVTGLLARLIYGTGLRLREALALRIKDVDFGRKVIVVRQGKGGKDRVVMLPQSLVSALHEQVAYARALWEADRQANLPGVELPYALEAKNIRAQCKHGRGSGCFLPHSIRGSSYRYQAPALSLPGTPAKSLEESLCPSWHPQTRERAYLTT